MIDRTSPEWGICRKCRHARPAPMSGHHIQCTKPPELMLGSRHGIDHGWFNFPYNFDPIWRESACNNYTPKAEDK